MSNLENNLIQLTEVGHADTGTFAFVVNDVKRRLDVRGDLQGALNGLLHAISVGEGVVPFKAVDKETWDSITEGNIYH